MRNAATTYSTTRHLLLRDIGVHHLYPLWLRGCLSGRRHLGAHRLLVHVMGRHSRLVVALQVLLRGRLRLLLPVDLSAGLVVVALLLA